MSKSIKPEFLDRLRNDEDLILAIAKGLRFKFRTVENWARDEHHMLTSDAVIALIEKYTGLKESDFVFISETKTTTT